MTAAAQLRTREPWRLDALIQYSGDAYRRAARTAKHVATAHGLSVSRAVRYRQGDPSAPLTHALTSLATAERTTAWPALVEGIALVTQLEIEKLSEADLVNRRAELDGRSFDLNRDAHHAIYAGDDAEAERVHAELAALHLEQLAIVRVLREKRRAR